LGVGSKESQLANPRRDTKSLPLWGRWLAEGQTDEVGVRVTHSIWNGRHEWRPYGSFVGTLSYSLLPTPYSLNSIWSSPKPTGIRQ